MEIGGINSYDPTGIIASAKASYHAKERIQKRDDPKKYENIVHPVAEAQESEDKPYDPRNRQSGKTFEDVLGRALNELS